MSLLDQIIKDLYVDPELLAELSEEQKEILFCKMREEQVRRWTEREEELEKKEKKIEKITKPNKKGHKVDFMHGPDGNPWVWVMGEHTNDKTIEQILEEEAQKKAKEQAMEETQSLSLRVNVLPRETVAKGVEIEVPVEEKFEETDEHIAEKVVDKINIKTAEKREETPTVISNKPVVEINHEKTVPPPKPAVDRSSKPVTSVKPMVPMRKPQMQRLSSMKEVEHYQQERCSQIYENFKMNRTKTSKEAEEKSTELERQWQEQEEKAKRLEKEKQDMARKARKEYRESIQGLVKMKSVSKAFLALQQISETVKQAKDRPSTTPTKTEILQWFKDTEKPRGVGLDPVTKQVLPWLHGMISRKQAEDLLEEKPIGAFLVRLSEKIFGYAVSYRGEDRCKHFLINTNGNQYQFFGTNQLVFPTLHQLISSHQKNPISVAGNEKLLHPCGQSKGTCDYNELFSEETFTTKL